MPQFWGVTEDRFGGLEAGGRDSYAAVCRIMLGNSAPLQTIKYEKMRDKVKPPAAYAKCPYHTEGETGTRWRVVGGGHWFSGLY
jgi:hypothetical protein